MPIQCFSKTTVLFKKRAGKKSLHIVDQHLIISHYDNYSYYENCFVYLKTWQNFQISQVHITSSGQLCSKSLLE